MAACRSCHGYCCPYAGSTRSCLALRSRAFAAAAASIQLLEYAHSRAAPGTGPGSTDGATGVSLRRVAGKEKARRGNGAPVNLEVNCTKDQRIGLTSVVAVTGALALITVASRRPLPVLPSVMREAMPMPATRVAHTSDRTTILRWVIRS